MERAWREACVGRRVAADVLARSRDANFWTSPVPARGGRIRGRGHAASALSLPPLAARRAAAWVVARAIRSVVGRARLPFIPLWAGSPRGSARRVRVPDLTSAPADVRNPLRRRLQSTNPSVTALLLLAAAFPRPLLAFP